MPITSINTPIPLSSAWTYSRLSNYTRSVVSEADNERVLDLDIRSHINNAISHVVESLSLALTPHYGVQWDCEIEANQTVGTPTFIDLTIVASGLIPIQHLSRITLLIARGYGECSEVPVEVISTLSTDLNTKYKQSVLWCWHGERLYVYIGTSIRSTIDTDTIFTLWGYRQPTMDDLLPPSQSTTYNSQIDIPNRYIHIVKALTQKYCLEQLGKNVPVELTGLIEQSMGITNNSSFQSNQMRKI